MHNIEGGHCCQSKNEDVELFETEGYPLFQTIPRLHFLTAPVGKIVQSLDIILQDFIVVLVTGLKTLTNFVVVKWMQVTTKLLLNKSL